jgi:PAS domain S-box-containing protein
MVTGMTLPHLQARLARLFDLRARIVLIGVLLLVPVVGLELYLAHDSMRHNMTVAHEKATLLVEKANGDYDDVIVQAKTILQFAATADETKPGADCHDYMLGIKNRYEWINGMAVIGADGEKICGSRNEKPPNLLQRDYFRAALATKQFSISDYLVGSISHQPIMAVAYPVLDAQGNVARVFIMGISLQGLNKVIAQHSNAAKRENDDDTSITIFDKTGTVMARYPDGLSCIGINLWDKGLLEAAQLHGKGSYDGMGMLGDKRIFAFEKFAGTESFIAVGLPKAPIMARVHQRLYVALCGLIAIISSAVVVALLGAEFLILRPLRRVEAVTQVVATGKFEVPDTLVASLPAMAELVTSFRDMARQLKAREEELHVNKSKLYETRRYLSLSEQVAHVGHWRVEFPSNKVHWSDEVYRIHGLDAKLVTPTLEIAMAAFHPDDRAEVARHIELARQKHCDFEFILRILRPGGEVRYIQSRGFCELDANGEVSSLFGAIVDITALKEIEAKMRR